jgi:hypothetical protein
MRLNIRRRSFKNTILPYTISCLILQSFFIGIVAESAWANSTIAQLNSIEFTPPPPPPDRDAPGSRGGGAGRGCGAIMALVPEYQQTLPQGGAITKVWGTTIAERPTFWFDVPYEKGAIASLEFVLQDNSHPAKDIIRTTLTPPETPGIINFRLPETVPPLATGKLYQWFFKIRLQCGSSQSMARQKEELYGWVQRISPSATLINQLKQATPQQQAILYAQSGIWYDALTTLGELRLTNSQNAPLTKNWNQLLQIVGLEKLATKPLIQCCTAKLN